MRNTDTSAPLKMHFFRDCGVSAVLESSGITYTLRFCARCFLALAKKLLFLEVPTTEHRPAGLISIVARLREPEPPLC